uniref:Uncharacterized protein n=1 Tax=Arundo donax TaxID=35708 RepID=A0A0A9AX24_ARUDO
MGRVDTRAENGVTTLTYLIPCILSMLF